MAPAYNGSRDFGNVIDRPMLWFLLVLLSPQLGCRHSVEVGNPVETSIEQSDPSDQPKGDSPARITNQFGMTFCLVEVDPEQWFHLPTHPPRSYYLQETELRPEQHEAFRKAAFGDGTYETIDWHYNGGYPSEWRQVFRYAEALSKFDAEYDYRLPSLREWTFACKDGYDQNCPEHVKSYGPASTDGEPVNKFGIFGLNNHDVECGNLPGLFFGRHGRPNAITAKPDCCCDWWTKGNADADDGLNELITARFVLVLKE